MPEDFWISSSKKGIVIFALPGKPGLAELAGDFRIYFHDRHGDFYCWLNTTMIKNRTVLSSDDDLDGFDKRKLPSPRFQLEIVMVDYDASIHGRPRNDRSSEKSDGGANPNAIGGNSANGIATVANQKRGTKKEDNDVFSHSDGEGGTSTVTPGQNSPASDHTTNHHVADVTHKAARLSMGSNEPSQATTNSSANETINGFGTMDFKAIVADASVFSFGDEDEYGSE